MLLSSWRICSKRIRLIRSGVDPLLRGFGSSNAARELSSLHHAATLQLLDSSRQLSSIPPRPLPSLPIRLQSLSFVSHGKRTPPFANKRRGFAFTAANHNTNNTSFDFLSDQSFASDAAAAAATTKAIRQEQSTRRRVGRPRKYAIPTSAAPLDDDQQRRAIVLTTELLEPPPLGPINDPVNQRALFEWATKRLGMQTLDGWNTITMRDLDQWGVPFVHSIVHNYYGDSLWRALSTLFPEHEWFPWQFASLHRGAWTELNVQRKFFEWAGKHLGLREGHLDDWYRVKHKDLVKVGGGTILSYYKGSLVKALSAVFPEKQWIPWRFGKVPNAFWSDRANHKKFFDWAAQELNISPSSSESSSEYGSASGSSWMDAWYRVSHHDIVKLGGGGLLNLHYDDSLYKALTTLYPEHDWLPWRFTMAPQGYWSEQGNQRRFLEWAARELNLRSMDDWSSVTRDDIIRLGGSALLNNYHDGSVYRLVSSAYPEHPWQPWLFQIRSTTAATITTATPTVEESSSTTSNSNNNNNNNNCQDHLCGGGGSGGGDGEATIQLLRQYIDYLARELQIEQLDEWYRVSLGHIRNKIGGYYLIERYGGLQAVLKRVYPQHNWSEDKWRRRGSQRKSSQRMLRLVARNLFPALEIFEEYQCSDLAFSESAATPLELDIFFPALSLALEFQGQHHYHDVFMFGNQSRQRQRDVEKAQLCKKAGITLITVPYWWDQSAESLAATICKARPDLLNTSLLLAQAAAKGTPIPESIPTTTTTTVTHSTKRKKQRSQQRRQQQQPASYV